MKNHLISIINKVLLAIVALLGFSCSPDDPNVEYGMPTANFKAFGSIIDESSLNSLSNIEVVMQGDTVYSDENGNYEITVTDYPGSQVFTLSFKDLDGITNGAFLPADTLIDFSDEEFTDGDGSWYSGEKTKEINIELSPDETI